jgi:hypothetical protein
MRALLLLAFAAAAVSPQQRIVIKTVKAQLKDPASARFKGVKQTSPGHWCGWVNAKNSYGGYTGFQVFFWHDGKAALLTPDLSEPGLC